MKHSKEEHLFSDDLKKISSEEAVQVEKLHDLLDTHAGEQGELSSVERDTLRFIRSNVLNEIEAKAQANKPTRSNYFYLKIAAVAVFLCVQAMLVYQFGLASSTGAEPLPVITDARNMLAKFSSLNAETPEFVYQINIDEASALLSSLSKAKEDGNLDDVVDELEPILLAISSLKGENGYLEIRLIQEKVRNKKLIDRLASI